MKKVKMSLTVCVALAGLMAAETSPDKDKKTDEKVIGTVVVEDGQKMPNRVSFVDKKAVDEKRATSPVFVPVDKYGKFEMPALGKLPKGYVLTTFPTCVKLKAVTVAGIDIRTPLSEVTAKFGAASAFAENARTIFQAATGALGGVQFDDCSGGEKK